MFFIHSYLFQNETFLLEFLIVHIHFQWLYFFYLKMSFSFAFIFEGCFCSVEYFWVTRFSFFLFFFHSLKTISCCIGLAKRSFGFFLYGFLTEKAELTFWPTQYDGLSCFWSQVSCYFLLLFNQNIIMTVFMEIRTSHNTFSLYSI